MVGDTACDTGQVGCQTYSLPVMTSVDRIVPSAACVMLLFAARLPHCIDITWRHPLSVTSPHRILPDPSCAFIVQWISSGLWIFFPFYWDLVVHAGIFVVFPVLWPSCGAGAPLFPPCPFSTFIFCPFSFLFLSLALPIFFFCPSLPFLPE